MTDEIPDVVYGLADAGLVSLAVGDTDGAENALKEIKAITEDRADTDSDAFENYEGTHV